MQIRISNPPLVQFRRNQTRHPLPSAEYHDLVIAGSHYALKDIHSLLDLRVESGLLVKDIGTVANHTHLREEGQQALAVRLAKIMHLPPFEHDTRDGSLELLVHFHLLARHRHQQVLVHTSGKLYGHIGFPAAEQHVVKLFPDSIQAFVASDLARVGTDDMLLTEFIIRAQTILVHQLDYGIKFFQFVLQRRSGKHDHIIGMKLSGRAGNLSIPVLQALHLIHYNHIRLDAAGSLYVVVQRIVRNDLEEPRLPVHLTAHQLRPLDYQRILSAEILYLALPLVFERGRADNQDRTHEALLVEQRGRSDGLNRLAKTHFIGNYASAGTCGKLNALPLVRIGLYALGKHILPPCGRCKNIIQPQIAVCRIHLYSSPFHCIIVTAERDSQLRGIPYCRQKPRSLLHLQTAVPGEQALEDRTQFSPFIPIYNPRTGLRTVIHINPRKALFGFVDTPAFGSRNPGRDCLQMLAAADTGSPEVHTGAAVQGMTFPIKRNPVFVPGLCIANGVLSRSSHRIRFPDGKIFLLCLLPPQRQLPFQGTHFPGLYDVRNPLGRHGLPYPGFGVFVFSHRE